MIAKLSLPLILALASVAHAAGDDKPVAGAPKVAEDIKKGADELADATKKAANKENALREAADAEKNKADAEKQNAKEAKINADELKDENEELKAKKVEADLKAEADGEALRVAKQAADDQKIQDAKQAQEKLDKAQAIKDKKDADAADALKRQQQGSDKDEAESTEDDAPPQKRSWWNPANYFRTDPAEAARLAKIKADQVAEAARLAKIKADKAADDLADKSDKWLSRTTTHLGNHKVAYGAAALTALGGGLAWVDGKLVSKNGETVDRQLVEGDVPAIAVPQGEATHQAYLAKESGASTLAFVGALATTAVAALTLAL